MGNTIKGARNKVQSNLLVKMSCTTSMQKWYKEALISLLSTIVKSVKFNFIYIKNFKIIKTNGDIE